MMRLYRCFQVVINLTWGSLSEIRSVYPCSIGGQPRSRDVIVGVTGRLLVNMRALLQLP